MNSTQNSVNTESPDGGNAKEVQPLTVENARVMRLLITMYEAGWNDAIDATIRAKHETVNPMKKIRKLLEDFRDEQNALTESDETPATSEPILGADK
jgi:hypothetical protein